MFICLIFTVQSQHQWSRPSNNMPDHLTWVWKACWLIRPRKGRSLQEQRFLWNKQRRRMRNTMLQIAHARSNAAAHHILTTITPPGAYHKCEDMCARIKCLFTLLYGFAIFVVPLHARVLEGIWTASSIAIFLIGFGKSEMNMNTKIRLNPRNFLLYPLISLKGWCVCVCVVCDTSENIIDLP